MNFFTNPEFVRLRRSRLRAKELLLRGLLTFFAFGGIFAMMWGSARANPFINMRGHMLIYFCIVTGIQLGLMTLYGAILAAANIATEREKGTFDFQRMCGMSPLKLAYGKLFGAVVEAYYPVLIGFFFAAIPVVMNAVPLDIFLVLEALILFWGLLVSAVGLFCSVVVEKANKAGGLLVLFLITLFVWTTFASQGMMSNREIWRAANPVCQLMWAYVDIYGRGSSSTALSASGDFYTNGTDVVPCQFSFLIFNGGVTILFLIMTARRMADDDQALLTRFQSSVAFACFEAAVYSLIAGDKTGAFYLFNFFFLIYLAFACAPGKELLVSRIARAKDTSPWRILLEGGNHLGDSPALLHAATLSFSFLMLAVPIVSFTHFEENRGRQFPYPPLEAKMGGAVIAALAPYAVAAAVLCVQLYSQLPPFKTIFFTLILMLIGPPAAIISLLNFEPGMEGIFSVVNPVVYFIFLEFDRYARQKPFFHYNAWVMPLIVTALAVGFTVLAVRRLRFLLEEQQRNSNSETPVAPNPPGVLNRPEPLPEPAV